MPRHSSDVRTARGAIVGLRGGVGHFLLPASVALGVGVLVSPSLETWKELPTRDAHFARYEDLHFPSPVLGWAIDFGGVLRTDDAGLTWSQQTFPGRWGRSIAFATERLGWVGTLDSDQPLFETRDGGETWSDISDRLGSDPPIGLCGLATVGAEMVVGVGRYGGPAHFVKSVTGGETWEVVDLTFLASQLIDVHFWNPSDGIAVGSADFRGSRHVLVIGTEDGGATWTVRYRGEQPDEWAWKIAPIDTDAVVVSIESPVRGAVLMGSGRGTHWTEVEAPQASRAQGVAFLSPERGWIGTASSTWVTRDGGTTWTELPIPSRVNRFQIVDQRVYAAGSGIFVLDLAPTLK